MDCGDNSDELLCNRILESHAEMPPPLLGGNRTKVSIHVSVENILNIDEFNELIMVQAHVSYTWFDQRQIMLNLNSEDELNLVEGVDRQKVWFPKIILSNTEGKEVVSVENNTVVLVKKKGKSQLLPPHYIDNSLKFDGGSNPLHVTNFIVHDFLCSLTLMSYPFDTQTCYMDLQLSVVAYMVIDSESSVMYVFTVSEFLKCLYPGTMENHWQAGLRCPRCPPLAGTAIRRRRFVSVLSIISGL